MCLCNEQANKICFLVQAVYNEIDGVLLPKVNTDPDVSAHSQQGAGGLSYISNVDSLNHLAMFWMSNWCLEVKAVQPAAAQGTLIQLRCGKCSKFFYIKLIFSVFFFVLWNVCPFRWSVRPHKHQQIIVSYCNLLPCS